MITTYTHTHLLAVVVVVVVVSVSVDLKLFIFNNTHGARLNGRFYLPTHKPTTATMIITIVLLGETRHLALLPVLLLCARGLLDGGRAGMLHNVVVEEAAALMVPLLGRGYLGRARILALEQADLPM